VTTPKSKPRKKALPLPGVSGIDPPTVLWFAPEGCVVTEGERRTVVIAKRRVGSWEPGEEAVRNVLLVGLAQDESVVLEDLARAFDISPETLRLIRRQYEAEGLDAVMKRGQPHHKGGRRLDPALRRRMERWFSQGKSCEDVAAELQGKVHRATVYKCRRRWEQQQARMPKPARQTEMTLEGRRSMPQVDQTSVVPPSSSPACESARGRADASNSEPTISSSTTAPELGDSQLPPIRAPRGETSERVGYAFLPRTESPPPEELGAFTEVTEFAPFSAKGVQYVGAWLLLVATAGLGLYSHLRRHERRRPLGRPLRVAIDALLSVLAIGGRCVEGVRRLATGTAAALLLAECAPSATWVRRTLGGYCSGGVAEKVLEDVAGRLLREAQERRPRGQPVVLFFDNHGRRYTGRHLLRRIWRMQDKHTVPGAMDYWVHDVQGRPVLVIPVAPHASLSATIQSKVAFLREKLGEKTPLLLVFDRAGAFPGLWKWLRDNKIEFVTYQRARYRKFRREWFERNGRRVALRDAGGKKVKAMVQESRMNLGQGRGRVRRIRLLLPDDVQINVIASSKRHARWLCQTLFSRWRQENGLKHGVERWGLNQLDGRQVEDVPRGTLVTNPFRTNLDRLLKEDRRRERDLRLQFQQLYPGHPQRAELKRALAANRAAQREIKNARRQTPKKVPIEQTELCGELKQHTREYKLLVDTLRCAAQNAEGELATSLAVYLPRRGEAKRLLRNVFSAPGNIRVTQKTITVRLDPAANAAERPALEAFFAAFNRRRLGHPGDPHGRPIRFQLQNP